MTTLAISVTISGRRWTGWTGPAFWPVLAVFIGLLSVPFYLMARTRTTKKTAPAGPGWYPDPAGDHRLRYWDGLAWTTRTAPK